LLTLDSGLKIAEVAHISGLLFPMVPVMYSFGQQKNGLGYILGDFFTNSSGHPDVMIRIFGDLYQSIEENRRFS
jgi:hypothetical protein